MRGITARVAANLLFLALFSAAVVLGAFLTFVSGLLFDDSYLVTVPMPEAGGVLPDQEVTVMGRAVGQVRDVELTEEGVTLTLEIDGEHDVPRNARVRVLRRSPIGEQAVDFDPVDSSWTPAEEGAEIVPVEAIVPAEVPFLLEKTVELFEAVDPAALGVVVHELAAALEGRGDQLKRLNRDVIDFNETIISGIPEFERLLDSSETVLETLDESADDLARLFSDGADLAEVLAAVRPQVDGLLDRAPGALREVESLVVHTRANLQCVMEDVTDLNDMLLGPSTATGEPAALYDSKLDEVQMMFDKHRSFFQLGFGVIGQHDPATGVQWVRIQFVLDELERGAPYEERRPTPATKPGGACEADVWGTGVNAARQDDPQPPHDTSPGILYAPLVEETDTDAPAAAPRTGGTGGTDDRPSPAAPVGAPPLPATGGGTAALALVAVVSALFLRQRRTPGRDEGNG